MLLQVQQKDSDLRMAWSQLHALNDKMEATKGKLEASDATKGQRETQVLPVTRTDESNSKRNGFCSISLSEQSW